MNLQKFAILEDLKYSDFNYIFITTQDTKLETNHN